ncbi:MAG: acyltransferase family protein [Prevotellamassilia sp.]
MVQIKQHWEYLDLAKGLGILLVVLGHGMFPCHFAIDIFHMPLFFVLSGLTFTPLNLHNIKIFMLKKLERVMLPFFFFSVVSGILELFLGKANPNGVFNAPLWFLQTLFLALLIYAVLRIYFSNKAIYLICLIIGVASYYLYAFTLANEVLPFGLLRVAVSIVFIHIGAMVGQYYHRVKGKKLYLLFFLSVVLYVVGVGVSLKFYTPATIGASYLNGKVLTYSPLLFWATSLSGIGLVLFFSKMIRYMVVMNWLGKHSLVIMCVHFPLLEWLNVSCSHSVYYQSTWGKLLLAGGSYLVVFLVSCLAIVCCKRFIPAVTGYRATCITKY